MDVVNATEHSAEPAGESTIVDGDGRSNASAGDIPRGTTIGRYVVLDRVGQGGMGVVYAAYDPDLDRKVAIKVLHRVGQGEAAQNVARARLLREAQALAKLPHPNVVTIHDVGTFAERAWIAMEFVTGQTVAKWMRAEVRPWSAVLDVMLAAGDGVAAAHAAGLLHRDLKPDNVMLSDDARVRVMDFGLARGRELEQTGKISTSGPLISSSTVLALDVTGIGALVGTPAYMAPEQLGATGASTASDQFSYCVMLWEALYGARPFSGNTVHEHLAAMLDGAPKRGPHPVPAWLRRILERGLALVPASRHASVAALLGALRSGRQRARQRRVAFASAAVAAIAVSGWGIGQWRHQAAIADCEADAAAISVQWPGRRRDIVDALEGTSLGFARATVAHLPPWLDQFTERWTATAARVCIAARVDETMDLARQRQARACLDAHAVSLEALLDSLAEATPVAVRRAVSAAARLPDSTRCGDARMLASAPWSEDIDHRRVAELRAQLARADAVGAVGRSREALAINDEVLASAIALGWAPLIAEARMVRGGRLSELSELSEAEATLREAYFEALRAGADLVAARAAMWLVRTVGYQLGRHDDGLSWGEHAASVLDRVGGVNELERASLDSMHSSVHRERGAFAEARRVDERVLEIRERVLGSDHPDVADALDSLGNTFHQIGDNAAAVAAHRRSLEIRERVFGPLHPMVAASLNNLANAVSREEGEALLLRAIAIGDAAYGPDSIEVAPALANLGAAYLDDGRFDEAKALMIRALAVEERVLGPDHHEVAGSLGNLGGVMLQLGEFAEAGQIFARATAIAERRLDATHPLLGQLRFNLGLTHVARGQYAAAEVEFRSARTILSAAAGHESLALKAGLRLTTVLRQQGRLDEAQREIDAVIALHAGRAAPIPSFVANTLYERGEIALARGEASMAVALFRESLAAEVDPDGVPEARTRFAIAIAGLEVDGVSNDGIAAARGALADLTRLRAPAVELAQAQARLESAARD